MELPKNNKMEKDLLEKIKSGDIKMKPKYYFVLKTVALILGIVVLFLFLFYFVSFIIFSLRSSGLIFLPGFGFAGIKILTGNLPWFLILFSFILILIIEIFAEHLYFVYKKPAVYSLLAIMAIVIFGGILVDKTPLHMEFFRLANDRQVPLVAPFYRQFGMPKINNVYNGIVSDINGEIITIETPNGQSFKIDKENLKETLCNANIKRGDMLIIIAQKEKDSIKAFKIKKINEDPNIFPYHRKMKMAP